ncbi:MAG: class I SAM-dependent methyltransferase, partial [Desulfobacterales bacterium]|nr:class I SAM-dependent methyltransferase [Desulfobacterales bacterium]
KGDKVEFSFKRGEIFPGYDNGNIYEVSHKNVDNKFIPNYIIKPSFGRFYPRGMLKGIPGIFRANILPFRCIDKDVNGIKADFNHCLAEKDLNVVAVIHDVKEKPSDRGGSCRFFCDMIPVGPGMQARWKNKPTIFFSDSSFDRNDENEDIDFYINPRFVNHIDDNTTSIISKIYGKLIENGMDVLDLMASWKSHVPEEKELRSLTGLGLNREELERNNQLSNYLVHDLNLDTLLPFDNCSFDVVICTVSVEYITHPFDIFEEVARILRPEGYFIVSFSNRWFPPKVINIWKSIHEVERMGLVLEYFLKNGRFKNLNTYSVLGMPRPPDDKYYSQIADSDPVYILWGQSVNSNLQKMQK